MRVQWQVTRSLRRPSKGGVFRHAVALWFALVAANVSAQVSGSLTLVSDYRFRGVSLSHNNPAAQLGAVYDDARGWYAGAFASTVQFADPSSRELQMIAFGGYVWRFASGLSSEVGADYSAFTGRGGYSYPEVYWGIAYENDRPARIEIFATRASCATVAKISIRAGRSITCSMPGSAWESISINSVSSSIG